MAVQLKPVRKPASRTDGRRVLVDRQRPRGMERDELVLAEHLPALAPTPELARWFRTRPSMWLMFRRRYLEGLEEPRALEALLELEELAQGSRRITLLTAAKDLEHSHAAVLRDLLSGVRKPPASSGPQRAAASGRQRARRQR